MKHKAPTLRDRILRSLEAAGRPMEYKSLAALYGCKAASVGQALKAMLEETPKLIYVAHYAHSRGAPLPFYMLGDLPDAERPAPIPGRERQRKSLSNIKATQPAKWRNMMKKKAQYVQRLKREDPDSYRAMLDRKNERRYIRSCMENGKPAGLRAGHPLLRIDHPLIALGLGLRIDSTTGKPFAAQIDGQGRA